MQRPCSPGILHRFPRDPKRKFPSEGSHPYGGPAIGRSGLNCPSGPSAGGPGFIGGKPRAHFGAVVASASSLAGGPAGLLPGQACLGPPPPPWFPGFCAYVFERAQARLIRYPRFAAVAMPATCWRTVLLRDGFCCGPCGCSGVRLALTVLVQPGSNLLLGCDSGVLSWGTYCCSVVRGFGAFVFEKTPSLLVRYPRFATVAAEPANYWRTVLLGDGFCCVPFETTRKRPSLPNRHRSAGGTERSYRSSP